ncbi:hypothetical protein A3H89_01530 [Candidatus Amesbacteria bacterium RIFCSPLOWO2_02_FULL_48_11]|uniref:Uncharacterized protein n=1 Tax=Candidatus Amesbacteria bacterium RIFCSPHIGHO2_12_FULL_48_14 TaxID=1797257 RepID=A0A1F4Z8Q6_9BACT|nr:MAG: hypothetical protein A2V48_03965 [Candidatus Amesbacteria bacterium RBG_19FT_COMBO_48_16]OGD01765.1 MAG: hypothetical protein A2354_02690 [Candidatus Amesbacteria bacterium RIFOXYB1_FULL_47_12]OGD02266.1 MAG: hypothetical protein A3E17_00260 [Candidatus Amesbacteria bacterium RIFCSPHIGHO2_12_FULL_48_14]OGD07172.1 MAG: hypothetical protein A3H89_01530 [Candidatus Amesbacteria bacterium RIFCSPLOWO2_02_FULL_48_11]
MNIEGGDFEVQAVKWGDGIGNWDWEAVVQQFIPFTFKLYLPPLRKARIIIERNNWGQIRKARVPYVKTHQVKFS